MIHTWGPEEAERELEKAHLRAGRLAAQVGELTAENHELRQRIAELDSALRGLLPFTSEDFPNGPDGPSCVSDAYREAYRAQIAALREGKG